MRQQVEDCGLDLLSVFSVTTERAWAGGKEGKEEGQHWLPPPRRPGASQHHDVEPWQQYHKPATVILCSADEETKAQSLNNLSKPHSNEMTEPGSKPKHSGSRGP